MAVRHFMSKQDEKISDDYFIHHEQEPWLPPLKQPCARASRLSLAAASKLQEQLSLPHDSALGRGESGHLGIMSKVTLLLAAPRSMRVMWQASCQSARQRQQAQLVLVVA